MTARLLYSPLVIRLVEVLMSLQMHLPGDGHHHFGAF